MMVSLFLSVIPAQAGIHLPALRQGKAWEMDSRLRGNDELLCWMRRA
jgi:flagellar P-ring protein precursor FlgI